MNIVIYLSHWQFMTGIIVLNCAQAANNCVNPFNR